MKKEFLVIALFFLTALIGTITYCYAIPCPSSEVQKEEGKIVSVVSGKKEKVLVTYFSLPETDGVDAIAGASRVIVEGELMGNTNTLQR